MSGLSKFQLSRRRINDMIEEKLKCLRVQNNAHGESQARKVAINECDSGGCLLYVLDHLVLNKTSSDLHILLLDCELQNCCSRYVAIPK